LSTRELGLEAGPERDDRRVGIRPKQSRELELEAPDAQRVERRRARGPAGDDFGRVVVTDDVEQDRVLGGNN
jgi:hypothetical protein